MRLAHVSLVRSFEWENNSVIQWVIEDPSSFTNYVRELKLQSCGKEGCFVLAENGKEINFAKKVEFVDSPLTISPNDKRVLSKLYSKLERLAQDENLYTKTQAVMQVIHQYLLDVEYGVESVLDFCPTLDLNGLFKLAEVKFFEEPENLAESIVLFLKNINEYLDIQLVIFVQLGAYLTKNQFDEIAKQADILGIKLLMIERSVVDIGQYPLYILDIDNCEI